LQQPAQKGDGNSNKNTISGIFKIIARSASNEGTQAYDKKWHLCQSSKITIESFASMASLRSYCLLWVLSEVACQSLACT